MRKLNNILKTATLKDRCAERPHYVLKDRCAVGLLLIALLVSCSTQRVTTSINTPPSTIALRAHHPQKVHTVSVPNARATLTIDGQTMSSRVAFSTTMDSLVIWSIQPFAGMEMFRLEATPTDLVVFDKTTMEYIPLTYESLLSYTPVPITYKEIQDIATGEILPKGQNSTLRAFSVAGMSVILNITYPEIRTNVPVNMNRMPNNRFSYKSLEQVLQ